MAFLTLLLIQGLSQKQADEAERTFGQEFNITTEGKRHLGAVIGSQEYKDQYCDEKFQGCKREIELLAEIVKSQPHAAYCAFTKGDKSKFKIKIKWKNRFRC